MSCGTLCPCQFNCSVDTHGFKRDTISSEKGWLDFAVRYLSREAAGKGNGQESVWNVESKPSWWDSEVGLPWKNPTTNPKDNKDVLLNKYNALEQHLRLDNRFPTDLEEEAKLWAAEKYKELFLLCDLASLLKKASAIHSAVVETCSKANKLKACINQDVLKNLTSCLNSTLKATDNFKKTEVSKPLKRFRNEGKENPESTPCKKLKVKENEKRFVAILPKSTNQTSKASDTDAYSHSNNFVTNLKLTATNPEDIFKYANKILEKQKALSNQSKIVQAKTCLKRQEINSPNSMSCNENNFVPCNNLNAKVVPYQFTAIAPNPVPLEFCNTSTNSLTTTTDPTSTNSLVNDPTSIINESYHEFEVDFLLSPLSSEPSSANGSQSQFGSSNCSPKIPTSFSNHPNQFDFENDNINSVLNMPDLDSISTPSQTSSPYSLEINVDDIMVNDNLSPKSTSSVYASDTGYASAEDPNFDANDFFLDRFLFDDDDASCQHLDLELGEGVS